MITAFQTSTEVLKEIEKYVQITGKEGGNHKIYFLENGNVAYIRFSALSPKQTAYYFLVSRDKYEEYKERFRLILVCGSVDRVLIIPSKDIEDLFRTVSLSEENKWYFYISSDLMLRYTDLSKYLNKWEFLNTDIKDESMEDKIRGSELRTKIYEAISSLSRRNQKCNHIYLCNDLYARNFNKYEILDALKFLEQKGTVYKIVYVNWYINIIYRENGIEETDSLLLDAFNAIKIFSKRSNWQYGLKKSDLYDQLKEKGHTEENIRRALKFLEEKKIIYKRSFIYWFTHEYTGEPVNADVIEDKEDIIYMPDKIQEGEIEHIEDVKDELKIEVEDIKIEDIELDVENPYSDLNSKINYLTKKWKELNITKNKIESERQKEIDLQLELDRKKEESVKRKKELDARLLAIDAEKASYEKIFNPINVKYDQDTVVEEKKMKIK